MKYEIVPSNQFKKDLKLAQKRGYDLDKIKEAEVVKNKKTGTKITRISAKDNKKKRR